MLNESNVKTRKMAAQFRWEQLPYGILVDIFTYLPLTDRLSATSVCKRWRSCLFEPVLWRNIDFSVNSHGRKRAKLLGRMCAKFVRGATLEFSSTSTVDVRESLKILKELSHNLNLNSLVLKPSSCRVEWPEERESTCNKLS